MTAGAGGDGGMGGEVIEVQILPQDDNWGDNTTAITGNTSVRSESFQVRNLYFFYSFFFYLFFYLFYLFIFFTIRPAIPLTHTYTIHTLAQILVKRTDKAYL